MKDWIRPSAVAGTFYSKDPAALRAQLAEFCAEPDEPRRQAVGILAPHAGYRYSGRIAGEIYRRISIPKLAIVLCPNHTGRGRRVSVWGEGTWVTPLGEVPVDEPVASRLLSFLEETLGDREAHLYEHAVEVQLPFLQHLNPDIRIVPVVLGPLSVEQCTRVGEALAKLVAERATGETLLVASTDMSHYIPEADAAVLDRLALAKVEAIDAQGLYRTCREKDISMCGFIPTTCVLEAVSKLGVKRGEVVAYGNSGDVTGDKTSVVGYAAASLERDSARGLT